MARVRYYYNPETCTFERAKTKTLDVALNLLGFFTLALLLAIGLTFVYGRIYKSEQEISLREENQELLEHYNLLSKELTEVSEMMKALQQRDDNVYRVIFEAPPIPAEVRKAGSGGANKYRDWLKKGLKNEKLIVNTAQKIDELKRRMYVQTKSYDEISQLVKNKSKMLACMPAIQPISNKQLTRLTSGFGLRIHPIYKVGQFHPGIDFAAPHGTPIYATGDGVVEKAVYEGGYGNYVVIDHGYGYKTLYAHMSAFSVKPGQKIKRGENIGQVGSTGFSTAPHVHYEVIHKGEQINPVYFFFKDLTADEYEKILQLASKENQSLS
jgi:murein DD-endopeptidase MepM/ murein hydrolase activator NlpD